MVNIGRSHFGALLLALVGMGLCRPGGAEDAKEPYDLERYPVLRQRIPFLKERLLSKKDAVRYRLQGEVGQHLPLAEAEQLLRQILRRDSHEETKDQVLQQLLSLGYKLDRSELPRRIRGVDRGWIDRRDADALKELLSELRGERAGVNSIKEEGAEAGYAAVLLGLLGDESDRARLRPLLKHKNIYVRFSAATAVLNLGDAATAKGALAGIASAPATPEEYVYIRDALLSLHRLGDTTAIQKYLILLRTLEPSSEPTARHHYAEGIHALSNLFGVWHDDTQAWQEWLAKRKE